MFTYNLGIFPTVVALLHWWPVVQTIWTCVGTFQQQAIGLYATVIGLQIIPLTLAIYYAESGAIQLRFVY